jgi:hypothetical protein
MARPAADRRIAADRHRRVAIAAIALHFSIPPLPQLNRDPTPERLPPRSGSSTIEASAPLQVAVNRPRGVCTAHVENILQKRQ